MGNKKESPSKVKHPNGRRWSLASKIEALEVLDSGQFTKGEVMEMYEIRTYSTLDNWRKQVSRGPITRRRYRVEEKRRIAFEVSSGKLSLEAAMEHYGITGNRTIPGWIARYAQDYEFALSMKKKGKRTSLVDRLNDCDREEFTKMGEELAECKLKLLALETLIDVAEEELGVAIRKKRGAKLSEECE